MLTREALAVFVLVAVSCSSQATAEAVPDDALVVAENAGALLAVVSLAPGDAGTNDVRVDLFASVDRVARRTRLALVAGGREVAMTDLAPGLQLPWTAAAPLRGALTVPSAGSYELTVSVEGQAAEPIPLELPGRRASAPLLASIDRAMNGLTSYREQQTLSGGGPAYEFRSEQRAPDRMRYTLVSPGGLPRETILIADRRWDRELGGHQAGWVASQGGAPIVVPSFEYAAKPASIRIIGRESAADGERDVIAFRDGARGTPVYYRLWVDTASHRVHRYVMMAFGHYMRGTYAAFDAAIEISAP